MSAEYEKLYSNKEHYNEVREMADELRKISYFMDLGKGVDGEREYTMSIAFQAYLDLATPNEFGEKVGDLDKTRAFVDYLLNEYDRDSVGLISSLKKSAKDHDNDPIKDLIEEFDRQYESKKDIKEVFEKIRDTAVEISRQRFQTAVDVYAKKVGSRKIGKVVEDALDLPARSGYITVAGKIISSSEQSQHIKNLKAASFWDRVDQAGYLNKREISEGKKRNDDYAFMQALRRDAAHRHAKMYNREKPNDEDKQFAKDFEERLRSLKTSNKTVMNGALTLTLRCNKANTEKRLQQKNEREMTKEELRQKRLEERRSKKQAVENDGQEKISKKDSKKKDKGLDRE